MNNLSKIVFTSALTLGAVLLSIGCGNTESCCDGNTPPKAKIVLLAQNNLNNNILPPNANTLRVNGIASSDNGKVAKAVWIVYKGCTKDIIIDAKGYKDKNDTVTLYLGNPGNHKVCLVVTDEKGLKNESCECVTVQPFDGPVAKISSLPEQMKIDCPLPTPTGATSISNSISDVLKYKWTLDGNNAGTNVTPNLPATFTATPNPHIVCLRVTDDRGLANEICQNVEMIPHVAPTAVMKVSRHSDTNNSQANIPAGRFLARGTRYDLSCSGSQDDCTMTDDNLTCTWEAISYNEECAVPIKTTFIPNCFNETTNPITGAITRSSPYDFGEKNTTISTGTHVAVPLTTV